MEEIDEPNRVAGGFSPPAPTPPLMRIPSRGRQAHGRFTELSGPKPDNECSPTILLWKPTLVPSAID